MRITIKSSQVAERTVTRQADKKQFTFREQQGLVSVGEETRLVNVSLEHDQAPYAAGVYELMDGSFYVDRNSRLQIGRLALKLVASAPASVARVG